MAGVATPDVGRGWGVEVDGGIVQAWSRAAERTNSLEQFIEEGGGWLVIYRGDLDRVLRTKCIDNRGLIEDLD